MKTSAVSFAELRRLLVKLGFSETRKDAYWRFEHPESGAVLLFRPYSLDENVNMADLLGTRTQLDWRGLIPASTFDDSLTKTPA